MKKSIYILILILAFISLPAVLYAQSDIRNSRPKGWNGRYKPSKELVADSARYKITYQSYFSRDSVFLDDKKSGFTLTLIGENVVQFIDSYDLEASLLGDKLYATTTLSSNEIYERKSPLFSKRIFKERILIDYPVKGKITYQEYLAGAFRRYLDETATQNWVIGEETKEVLGYRCRKATCRFRGRDYVAWYAEELPIPYGPYYFRGLPGLIVELCDINKEYVFNMVGFERLTNFIPMKFYDGKGVEMLSRDDFRYLKQYYNENAAAAVFNNASGIKSNLTPEQEKELEKRLNRPRPYNPIEKE